MTKAEQWAANVKFLDRAILRGDIIVLSKKIKDIKTVSGILRKELDYLVSKGYELNKAGTELTKIIK